MYIISHIYIRYVYIYIYMYICYIYIHIYAYIYICYIHTHMLYTYTYDICIYIYISLYIYHYISIIRHIHMTSHSCPPRAATRKDDLPGDHQELSDGEVKYISSQSQLTNIFRGVGQPPTR